MLGYPEWGLHRTRALESALRGSGYVINTPCASACQRVGVTMQNSNNVSVNDDEIPNAFVEYFTSIAQKLTTQLPNSPNTVSHYLKDRINESFFMSPVTSNEVSNSISDLKNNGKGANTISSITLKNNKLTLSEILAHIFNNCISHGYFPAERKDGCT